MKNQIPPCLFQFLISYLLYFLSNLEAVGVSIEEKLVTVFVVKTFPPLY